VVLLAEERHVLCRNRTGQCVCVCVWLLFCLCVVVFMFVCVCVVVVLFVCGCDLCVCVWLCFCVCVCVVVCYIRVRISGVRKYGVDNLSCSYSTHEPYHVMILRGLTWDFM
jgi:hypothetical protein